jgi:hypothetical protein
MQDPSPHREPGDESSGRKGLPCRDPVQLADTTTAALQDRLDAITNAWREGDIELLRTLAQQVASTASEHGDAIVRQSGEELNTLAMHDEANASLIADKIEQLIRLCRRSA